MAGHWWLGLGTQFHISIWAYWLWCVYVACVWNLQAFRTVCNSIHHLSSCITSLLHSFLIMNWIHLLHYYAPAEWRNDVRLKGWQELLRVVVIFFKEISYAHQCCICYLNQKCSKAVILWNITILNYCFYFNIGYFKMYYNVGKVGHYSSL